VHGRYYGVRGLPRSCEGRLARTQSLYFDTGPSSNRRRLLAVIRSDFERIHSDIRHLLPHEMVPLPNHPDVVIPYQKLLAMERHRFWKFHEYVEDRLIEVNIRELLNGVDPHDPLGRRGSALDKKSVGFYQLLTQRRSAPE
jgi:hypothetical protein